MAAGGEYRGGPEDGRDGARPSNERPNGGRDPKTDATERVPPWEKPVEGHGPSWPHEDPASNGGPCPVMAAKKASAGSQGIGVGLALSGRDGARPSNERPNGGRGPEDGRDGARPSMGKTRLEGHGPSWAP